MAKTQLKKQKLSSPVTKTTPKKLKKPITNDSSSDSDSESIENLLEHLSKDQLITLVTNLALSNPSLSSRIHSLADSDISHRKIFIYGLSWDTTEENILSAFEPFGEIEDYKLVTDKVTGKAKGYAFITYKTRQGAIKALQNPQKKLCNRVVSCQLAAVGGSGGSGGSDKTTDVSNRKIYVSNVDNNVNVEKLRDFFAKFGEIESGPLGFDVETGKCKGYALFVYKSVDGAMKVLEEPYKVFEGKHLNVQKAIVGKSGGGSGGGASGITTGTMQVVPPMSMPAQQQQPLMAAAQALQLAYLGQNPNLAMELLNMNPMYSAMLTNPNLMNMNPFGLSPGPTGYGSYGVGSSAQVGPYGIGSSTQVGPYGIGSSTQVGPYGVGSSAQVGPLGLQQIYPANKNRDSSSSPAKQQTFGASSSYFR